MRWMLETELAMDAVSLALLAVWAARDWSAGIVGWSGCRIVGWVVIG
jgi:hypothetical protein